MSCNCLNKIREGEKFICSCDEFVHPVSLNIGAGLKELPRQLAGFPEFRRAMLRAIGTQPGLEGWQARDEKDLGVMLLEMWAYVCDSLSFYDKVIAQESYVNTSVLRPSLRKLVALLGYLPAPATGSFVQLTAKADGRSPLTLPAGMGFRSSGFGTSPPQVFELDKQTTIHPFTNKWTVSELRPDTIQEENPAWLLINPKAELKPFSRLLLLDYNDRSQHQVLTIKSVKPHFGNDGKRYMKLQFQSPAKLAAGTPLSRLWLLMPDPDSILWHIGSVLETRNEHNLASLKRNIKLYGIEEDYNWDFAGPEAGSHLERVASTTKGRPDMDLVQLALRYQVPTAGTIINDLKQKLSPGDQIFFDEKAEIPPDKNNPGSFAIVDKDLRGVIVQGNMNYEEKNLRLHSGEKWKPSLALPVDVFGNLLMASRGETVRNEILGSGIATAVTQSFKLAKKPLTYFLAPAAGNDRGVQNTLRVYINGIRWKEVPGFYGKTPEDEVYIVRQDDSGESYVIFGDGTRGRRLPSGSNNITAYYRYGAESASAPAGSVTQIQDHQPGLARVSNPVAAAGGSDAEKKESLRTNAPKSSLLLGRAVSIKDMETASLATPGVRTVQAAWHWHGVRQCPVVFIWYIGAEGIEKLLVQRLKALSDPSTPIVVRQATGIVTDLALDIKTDPRYIEEDVLGRVRKVLGSPDFGLLSPEKLGVGQPVFRSRIFEQIIGVEGVLSVNHILWNGEVFTEYAKKAATGTFFDFENGSIVLNGKK